MLVEQILEAARARDLKRVRARLSSDITVHEPPGLPYGGTYRGHDKYTMLHREWRGAGRN